MSSQQTASDFGGPHPEPSAVSNLVLSSPPEDLSLAESVHERLVTSLSPMKMVEYQEGIQAQLDTDDFLDPWAMRPE